MTSARIVSDAFFFDFSHATCDGVKNTATRSVFFSFAAAIALPRSGYCAPHSGEAARRTPEASRTVAGGPSDSE